MRSIPGSAKDIGSVFLAVAEYKLMNVQTTNMGSLFQLEYMLRPKEQGLEKALIDELRCLNGNLKISLGYAPKTQEVL